MLNLDDPMTQHIFRASALMDGVMTRGQRMSVSPSAVRASLLEDCLPLWAEMRELAWDHFGRNAEFILAAVDEYEIAIRKLASLGGGRISEDRQDGEGNCAACGTPITKFRSGNKHYVISCGACGELFMLAYGKLDSSEGFCTWAI